jgi:hypothetical protein
MNGKAPKPLIDRLMARVSPEPTTGCWIWTGTHNSNGYGKIRVDRRMSLTHRVAYSIFVGPLLDGMDIDHTCRNRACVNPDHLEQISHRDNTVRRNAVRTTCPRGHVYDKIDQGARRCSLCKKARARERALLVDP